MAPLIRAAGAFLLAAPNPAPPDTGSWRSEIAEASRRFAIPEEWIEKVMRAESGGRTRLGGAPIASKAGAMGLMQLMPATWEELRRRHGLGSDPHDPGDNILAGAAYLRQMYDRFGYPGLFAAYNAGPARFARHLEDGSPLPSETGSYLAKLLGISGGRPGMTVAQMEDMAVAPVREGAGSGANRSPIFVPLRGR